MELEETRDDAMARDDTVRPGTFYPAEDLGASLGCRYRPVISRTITGIPKLREVHTTATANGRAANDELSSA